MLCNSKVRFGFDSTLCVAFWGFWIRLFLGGICLFTISLFLLSSSSLILFEYFEVKKPMSWFYSFLRSFHVVRGRYVMLFWLWRTCNIYCWVRVCMCLWLFCLRIDRSILCFSSSCFSLVLLFIAVFWNKSFQERCPCHLVPVRDLNMEVFELV